METPPENTRLAELRRLVIEQKKILLPAEPTDPGLASLHQAVFDYDQLVSQVVIAAIQQMPIALPLDSLTTARERLRAALNAAGAQHAPRVGFYETYSQRLDRMLELARQLFPGQEDTNGKGS